MNASEFHWSLLVLNALSVVLLAGATYFLPRRWEERAVFTQKLKPVSLERLQKWSNIRATILDRNPGEWLAVRHSVGSTESWLFKASVVALASIGGVAGSLPFVPSEVGVVFLSIALLVVIIRLASQASYALAESRRSGAVEMLLSTPLNPRCLVTGQVVTLRKQFLPLFGLIFIAIAFCFARDKGASTLIDVFTGTLIWCGVITLVASTVASFGMWMGLREKSPNAAFFKTIVFTIILPGCVWCLAPVIHILLLLASVGKLRGRELDQLLSGDVERRYPPRPPEWPPRVTSMR